ncbi:hypothetical protein [Halorubrum tebenquichense]|uniref:DUF8151 domain-containing protein n=1 Tax=Halorubrum tebenquichense DSM 14210 TaxID=1227485 RepID=M0DJ63_9EURY|nr:hypothetical protein [Halorubrum tebenquichense]ELZ34762.1 hypothetical protein C472_12822 [Halorubrum tebenquichense DSM 14210]
MVEVPAVAVELAELLVVTLGAGVASVLGVVLEQFGLSAVSGGDLVLGAWAVGMGLIALYVGLVGLGYEQAIPRLRRLASGE